MKKSFIIGIIFLVAVLLVGMAWFFTISNVTKTNNTPPSNSLTPFSSSTPTITGVSPLIPNQSNASGTQPVIAHQFLIQIQNSNLITLKGTTVVSNYALQLWNDENKGGEALLEYDGVTHQWKLISLGGGIWSTSSLREEGVPQSIAEQLIANSGF